MNCNPAPYHHAATASTFTIPCCPFWQRGLTDRSQRCTIIARYGLGWSAPIILKQSCLAGQGLRATWCRDRWGPLIKAGRGPEIDVQKFKCSSSIWKIKAVWARLGDYLPVVEKKVWWWWWSHCPAGKMEWAYRGISAMLPRWIQCTSLSLMVPSCFILNQMAHIYHCLSDSVLYLVFWKAKLNPCHVTHYFPVLINVYTKCLYTTFTDVKKWENFFFILVFYLYHKIRQQHHLRICFLLENVMHFCDIHTVQFPCNDRNTFEGVRMQE